MRRLQSSVQETQLRLTIFRRTLSCLTDQARRAGGEETAPPELTYQLTQTRQELARLERRLADLLENNNPVSQSL
jgi:uncharacterized coiled-coil protein SlyX